MPLTIFKEQFEQFEKEILIPLQGHYTVGGRKLEVAGKDTGPEKLREKIAGIFFLQVCPGLIE